MSRSRSSIVHLPLINDSPLRRFASSCAALLIGAISPGPSLSPANVPQ